MDTIQNFAALTSECGPNFLAALSRFAIFPIRQMLDGICTCRKGAECASTGEHPLGKKGVRKNLQAGVHLDIPRGCGFGIEAGPSGLVVLDEDILGIVRDVPETLTVRSGRATGGRHYYFWHPRDCEPIRTKIGFETKLDVIAHDGMIIGPGSPHKSGGVYKVEHDAPIATLPMEWATRILAKQALKRKASDKPVECDPLDPSTTVGVYRWRAACAYLQKAPLSIKGQGGRNVFFGVSVTLMRRMRLPLDWAERAVIEVYNPRLIAAGTDHWKGEKLRERLVSAATTSSAPAGKTPKCTLDLIVGVK